MLRPLLLIAGWISQGHDRWRAAIARLSPKEDWHLLSYYVRNAGGSWDDDGAATSASAAVRVGTGNGTMAIVLGGSAVTEGFPSVYPHATGHVPRVARMLALAHHWRGLIRSGVVKDQASLARLVGVSRARISQVMDLLYLAPDIQEEILFLSRAECGASQAGERELRRVAAEPLWTQQRRLR